MEAGLINKSDGSYSHTDTWKYHLSEIFEWINARNSRYKAGEDDPDVNMYKTVFWDDVIRFVSKITDRTSITRSISSASKIEIAWTLEDMISAIVERVEFCKNEILDCKQVI